MSSSGSGVGAAFGAMENLVKKTKAAEMFLSPALSIEFLVSISISILNSSKF